VRVSWDFDKMKQVFQNLIQNSLDASPPGGKIIVTAQKSEHDRIEITVSDSGSGIPLEVQPKIFNLYFTTKASGTGIGLSIVQQIIGQHQGVIALESQEGKGTRFILNIPARTNK
jgi:signal transduction histidine kinase